MKISRREFSVLTSSVLAALAAPRAIADPLRVRRNVNYLSSAEIDVLRAGISAMAALPVEDFRSRLYQSHVHGAPWGWEDIYGDVPETDIYWNQCQHDTLHFLTWHRWYLLYFEQIVRELSGDTNFNLPYWNAVVHGFLPEAVRIPADESNSLYNSSRASDLNDGSAQVTGLDISAMDSIDFTDFSWLGIEPNPHNPVHNQVGGHMGAVGTAGLDPLFFLHHANIDRYWECWLLKGGGRENPDGAWWLDETFDFQTLAGPQTVTVSSGLLTSDLGYTYDMCPTGLQLVPPNLHFFYWVDWHFRLPPFPDPPPPWERIWLMSQPFVLDGRDAGFVLPRKELERAKLDTSKPLAVLLQDVAASRLVSQGGFFTEAWLAPDAAKLPEVGLRNAVRIGNFGGFELSSHAAHSHGDHQHKPGIKFKLPPAAVKLLEGKADPAVVFVRRGIADREGKPIAFDQKAELFKVGALALVSAASPTN